jgi:hypothetical protein
VVRKTTALSIILYCLAWKMEYFLFLPVLCERNLSITYWVHFCNSE